MEGCHESPTSIITDRPRAELWFSIACFDVLLKIGSCALAFHIFKNLRLFDKKIVACLMWVSPYISYMYIVCSHSNQPTQCPSVGWWYGYINGGGGVADRMCPLTVDRRQTKQFCFYRRRLSSWWGKARAVLGVRPGSTL